MRQWIQSKHVRYSQLNCRNDTLKIQSTKTASKVFSKAWIRVISGIFVIATFIACGTNSGRRITKDKNASVSSVLSGSNLKLSLVRFEAGVECSGGGSKASVWNELGGDSNNYDSQVDTLLSSKILCDTSIASQQGSTSGNGECTANGQEGCLTTSVFKAADLSNLTSSNIKNGIAIAGVNGTYPSLLSPLDSSAGNDLPSLSASVPAGNYQYFKSDGTRVTGTISDAGTITPQTSDQIMATSLYRSFTVKGDSGLTAGNIRSSISLFGVPGNLSLPGVGSVLDTSSYGANGSELTGSVASCTIAGSVGCLSTSSLKAYGQCSSDGSIDCAANATYRATREVSASILPSTASFDEGTNVVFNVSTTNISNGSLLAYRISGTGIGVSDLASGSLLGTATVNSNSATVTIPLSNDAAVEGPETLALTLYSPIGTGLAAINDTSIRYIPNASQTLFWYDAAEASTVTETSGKVSQWADKGPNTLHLTQSNSSYRPSYQTSGWNGGAMQYLDWGSALNPYSLVNTTPGLDIRELFIVAQFASSTFDNFEGLATPSNDTLNYFFTAFANTSTWYTNGPFGNDLFLNGETNTGGSPLPTLASPGLVHGRTASAVSSPGFTVGQDRAYNFLNRGWRGKIAEVIGYSTVLTVSERQKIEGYLAWKWGIESALVSGHPYKSTMP